MTSRQRFKATVNFGKVDRFFHREEGFWETTGERWHNEGLPEDGKEQENLFKQDEYVKPGIDLGWCGPAYYPPLNKEILSNEGRTNVVRDTDGIIKRELAERPELSMPQFLEYPVKNLKDWEKIKPLLNPYSKGRHRSWEDLAKRHKKSDRTYVLWQGLEGAYMRIRNMLGPVNLAYLLYDQPCLVQEILENWTALNCECFGYMAGKFDFDKVELAEDMCYKTGPLLSPSHIRNFLFPHYKTLFSQIRRACPDAIISIETDGNLSELIPLMMEIEVDMFSPFEVAAGNNVVEYRNRYPNLLITGGIDKRALAKDRDAIKDELERVLPVMWSKGGYFPAVDHTIPPDVSLDNYLFYLEQVRNFKG